MTAPDPINALKDEFESAEGSFMLELRCERRWNKQSFLRLVGAMQAYLEQHTGSPQVERWVAEGFWFLDHAVRDCSSHPDFPRHYEQAYYDAAYERLSELAYWFFTGESIYQSGTLDPFNA